MWRPWCIAASCAFLAWGQLPVYTPRHLRPIRWPADAKTPEDRGLDWTDALDTIEGVLFDVQRRADSWGTCLMDEAYFLFVADTLQRRRARTPEDSSAAWHQVWNATSYHDACVDTTGRAFAVAACLLVADDTLFAYGVTRDTTFAARAFVRDSLPHLPGYYRYDKRARSLHRVAMLAPSLKSRCAATLVAEQRDVTDP